MSEAVTREECDRHKVQISNEHTRMWEALNRMQEAANRDDVAISTALTTITKSVEFQGEQLQRIAADVAVLKDGNGHGPLPFRLCQVEERVTELWPVRHKVANLEHGLQLVERVTEDVRALKADKATSDAVSQSGRITRKDITLLMVRYLMPSLLNIIGLGLLAWFMIAQRGLALFGGD